MMAYAEGFEGPNVAGGVLSVAAAIGAALYKVSSKIPVGFEMPTNMSLLRKSTAVAPLGIECIQRSTSEIYFTKPYYVGYL